MARHHSSAAYSGSISYYNKLLLNYMLVYLNNVVVLITNDFLINCCSYRSIGLKTNRKPDCFKVDARNPLKHEFSDI